MVFLEKYFEIRQEVAWMAYYLQRQMAHYHQQRPVEKPRVRSWDVFDTLIVRSTLHPEDIFRRVEEAVQMPGFYDLRIRAQRESNQTWEGIYDQFQRLSGCSTARRLEVQEAELAMERRSASVIHENTSRVRDGDILVSDMYLPEEAIMSILRAAGFTKRVTLYASPAGKHSGSMWRALADEYDIEMHHGDNEYSDVEQARAHGIPAVLSTFHRFTPVEVQLQRWGHVDLSLVVRSFRLKTEALNGYAGFQAEFNVIFLVCVANVLAGICEREGLTRVLLTTRDGCLLEYVLPALHPHLEVFRFESSRVMNKSGNPVYADYVKKMYVPGRTVIFDVHGSVSSGRELFKSLFGAYPRVHLYDFNGAAPVYDGLTYTSFQASIGHVIETWMLDRCGTLVDFDDSGRPIRAPPSYLVLEVTPAHGVVQQFAGLIRKDKFARDVLRSASLDWAAVKTLSGVVVANRSVQCIRSSHHFEDNLTLTELANRFETDKGNAFACKHHYTKHYQRILEGLGSRDRVDMLEIGLSRGATHDVPSLRMWQAWFGGAAAHNGI